MRRLANYLWSIAWLVVVFLIPVLILGWCDWAYAATMGGLVGLSMALEEDGITLAWQTPRLYRNAGLYLKVRNKRYRIWKVGVH